MIDSTSTASKHFLLDRKENFRINIRRKQLDHVFYAKRSKFSNPTQNSLLLSNFPVITEFHQTLSHLSEPQIQENLIKLRESFTSEQALIPYEVLSKTGILQDLLDFN